MPERDAGSDCIARLRLWLRWARLAGATGGVLLVITATGTLIQAGDPGGWAWPHGALPLLLTAAVLCAVVWVPAEVGWRVLECQRALGSGPRTVATVHPANGQDVDGELVAMPDSRAFQLGREVERRRWERMQSGT